MNKIYVVLALDSGDSSDGVPVKVGQFKSKEEALEYVREDMRQYSDNYTWTDEETGETFGPSVYDETKMYVESHGHETSCRWMIVEVDPEA